MTEKESHSFSINLISNQKARCSQQCIRKHASAPPVQSEMHGSHDLKAWDTEALSVQSLVHTTSSRKSLALVFHLSFYIGESVGEADVSKHKGHFLSCLAVLAEFYAPSSVVPAKERLDMNISMLRMPRLCATGGKEVQHFQLL